MEPQITSPAQQRAASLLAGCALLAVALAPVAAILAWYSHSRSGVVGIWAAGVAGLVCWGAASLALTATFVGQRIGYGVQGLLAGILLRTGLPLVAGLMLQNLGGPLAAAGVFAMILGLYLCSLVAETLLAVRFLPASKAGLGGASSQANGA